MKNLIVFIILLSLTSCSSTYIVNSWKAEGAAVKNEDFDKVMVMALLIDESTRRTMEDYIADQNDALLVSYNTFSSKVMLEDEDACREILKKEGYNGMLTLRLVDVNKEQVYEPGHFNNGYWGYHNVFYPGFYEPGYFREDTKYVLETSIFSLEEDKLLWSGVTSTTNPGSVKKTAKEVVKEVRKQMVRDGFLIQD
jgi:hypothetical protein